MRIRMKTSRVCLLAVSFACLGNNVSFSQIHAVTVRIGLAKQLYLVGEPIFAHVSIENYANSTVLVRRWARLAVKDKLGNRLPVWGANRQESHPYFDTLALRYQDSNSYYLDLLPAYGLGKYELYSQHTKHLLKAGRYSVQAIYEQPGKDSIVGNVVQFSVVEPKGTDHVVFRALDKASDLYIRGEKQAAVRLLNSLAVDYPKSAYHQLVLLQKMQVYEWSDNDSDQRQGYAAAMTLIDRYPDSEAADVALAQILWRTKAIVRNSSDARKMLRDISNRYPGTFVGKRAKKGLVPDPRAKSN
jgi:hypothetical protein